MSVGYREDGFEPLADQRPHSTRSGPSTGSMDIVTGHSLGGFLALDVAAENHGPAATRKGPDPWDVLSPQAKAWLQAQESSGQRPLTKILVGYEGLLV
jgi:fermentation-respiration switch protein FrsA (DUF1100 family)